MNPSTVFDDLKEPLAQSAAGQETHFLDLLIVLSKRRKFILWFTFVVSILAVIIVFVIPNKYTAETIVLPPNENSSLSSTLMSEVASSSALASLAGAGLNIKNPGDRYVSLFRTQPVEDAVIRRFGLMARYHKKNMFDARRAFESHATVVAGAKDGLIRISVTDRDPKLAAEMANDYVAEFRKLSASLAITEASQRRAFFQQQLLEANGNLVTAEEAMRHTEQTTGVLQIDSQARALIGAAATLRGQIVEKEVQLQAMRTFATDDNPSMVLAEQQLAGLKAQLAQLAGKETDSGSDIIVPKGNIPAAQMEYVRSLRDLRYSEAVVEILAKQFEMAKLDEAREGAIIQVAQVAIPPDKRSSPMRTLTIILATLIGFFVACGWSVAAEGLERLKSDPAERRRLDALRDTFR